MLKVYKASAGSGKTFRLAVEYIKLLIEDTNAYKHILAVTFTNKATKEMKERIMSQLYGIANNLSDSDGYLERISEELRTDGFSFSDDEIRLRAGDALTNIVHDYSRFRIETIDSFFQSILHELAHELDLTSNLRVELNDTEMLSAAVDDLIDGLQEHSKMLDIVLDYINKNISAGKNWTIDESVKTFGKNVFNESYLDNPKEDRRAIGDPKVIKAFRAELDAEQKKISEGLVAVGKHAVTILQEGGFWDKMSGKAGSPQKFFLELAKGEKVPNTDTETLTKGRQDINTWFKKGNDALAEQCAPIGLPLLEDAIKYVTDAQVLSNSISVSANNLDNMQLLNAIDDRVHEIANENSQFLLADTANCIHDIIDQSDVPFIYEKTGTRFEHIMIDEFQDTSTLQWKNFKPLLLNALSLAKECLIVGDVKQSIYRWRNSDWRNLNNLNPVSELANDPNIDMEFAQEVELIKECRNFRSAYRIVDFNNKFIRNAVNTLSEAHEAYTNLPATDMLKAYHKQEQVSIDDNANIGFVRVENINLHADDDAPADGEEISAADTEGTLLDGEEKQLTYEEASLRRVLDTIVELHSKGVAYRDMAILTRMNYQIQLITKYINDHLDEVDDTFNMVSAEAFRLDSSSAVNLIMQGARWVCSSHAEQQQLFDLAFLAYSYRTHVLNESELNIDDVFSKPIEELYAMLPEGFEQSVNEVMPYMPIAELVEHLYNILGISAIKDQDAFLFCFFDKVAAYSRDKMSDIDSFIKYWDETMRKETIPNTSDDGLQLLTIHKSKGLEFHTVICPMFDWNIEGKTSNLLWCNTGIEPFNSLPFIPINFTTTNINSIFAKEHNDEVQKNTVDNLNLLYVAFTRAVNNLVIITGEKTAPKTSKKDSEAASDKEKKQNIKNAYEIISKSIPADIMHSMPCTSANLDLRDKVSILECGDIITTEFVEQRKQKKREKKKAQLLAQGRNAVEEANAFEQKYTRYSSTFHNSASLASFRQSNESERLITTNSIGQFEAGQALIHKGNVYHEVLSMMKTADDLDNAIEMADCQGLFESANDKDIARKDIAKALTNPQAAEWFAPRWTVMNERTIIQKAGNNGQVKDQRPDRVIISPDRQEAIVIDYKTGHEHPADYTQQVRNYIRLLTGMGIPNVKGYLWYILKDDDNIKKV